MIQVYSNDKSTQPAHYHCLRKRQYDSLDRAKQAAKSMTKRWKKKFAVYRCRYCNKWHVGTDRTRTFKYLTRKGLWGKQPNKSKKK